MRIATAAALVLGAVLFVELAAPARVRAFEATPATPTGVSVGAGFGLFSDGTLTDASGESVQGRRGELGVAVLGNVGDFAFGGVFAGSPGIFGDGREVLGARAGWQPTFGTTRVQVLLEMGLHRYIQVDEGLFSTSTPDSFSTSYFGVDLGITRELVKDGMFEYGVALMLRNDTNQQTIVHMEGNFLGGPAPPPTTLTVGGTMIGATLTLGFRLDRANVAAARPARHEHFIDR